MAIPSAGLDDLALTQIKGLIEAGNTTVIQKLERLEARLASFENRLDKIEHDGFETASKTDRLQEDSSSLDWKTTSSESSCHPST